MFGEVGLNGTLALVVNSYLRGYNIFLKIPLRKKTMERAHSLGSDRPKLENWLIVHDFAQVISLQSLRWLRHKKGMAVSTPHETVVRMKWDPECEIGTSLLDLRIYFKGLNLRFNWIWSSYLDHCPAWSLRGKETIQKNCQTVLSPNPHYWTLLPHYIHPPVLNWFSPRVLVSILLMPCEPTLTLEAILDLVFHIQHCPVTPAFILTSSPSHAGLQSFMYLSKTCGMLNIGKSRYLPSWRR